MRKVFYLLLVSSAAFATNEKCFSVLVNEAMHSKDDEIVLWDKLLNAGRKVDQVFKEVIPKGRISAETIALAYVPTTDPALAAKRAQARALFAQLQIESRDRFVLQSLRIGRVYALGDPNADYRVIAEGIDQARKAWTNVSTDPAKHDPNGKFRYIVHGIKFSEMSKDQALVFLAAQKSRDAAEHAPQPWDLAEDFSETRNMPLISASVVDNNHTVTWSNVGLILETPPENIFAAGPTDILSPRGAGRSSRHRHLVQSYLDNGLPSVEDVMSQTLPGRINEVVLTGTSSEGSQVKVAAVYIKKGTNRKAMGVKEILEQAKRLGLPIIELP
jgi:hypothetical protein